MPGITFENTLSFQNSGYLWETRAVSSVETVFYSWGRKSETRITKCQNSEDLNNEYRGVHYVTL